MKNFESLAEVLTFAISEEQASFDFYVELSQRAKKDSMKHVFLAFAEQEKLHRERLEQILGSTTPVALDASHHEEIAKYVAAVPEADNMTYETALKTAIHKEHAAMMLYQIMARLTPQQELKKVLELLAVEELNHQRTLEKEYHNILLGNN